MTTIGLGCVIFSILVLTAVIIIDFVVETQDDVEISSSGLR